MLCKSFNTNVKDVYNKDLFSKNLSNGLLILQVEELKPWKGNIIEKKSAAGDAYKSESINIWRCCMKLERLSL